VTDHRRWLEVAALRPTFSPSPAEATDLDVHLATCEACSREAAALRTDFARVARLEVPAPTGDLRARLRAAAIAGDVGSGSWNLATIAVIGLLAAALVGATLGVGAFLSRPDEPLTQLDANDPAVAAIEGKRIRWETEVVRLGADSVTIDANGKSLHAETPNMKIHSDPGSLTSWTLEVTWLEENLEQRLNVYFNADRTSWWIEGVQVYDNVRPNPDWASFPRGPHFRTPLGQPFSGDIDLAGRGRAGPVRLRIDGAVIAVAPQPSFVEPPGGGVVLDTDPFLPGGKLRCSGILQLSPREAETALQAFGYRLSWRFVYSTGPNSGYSEKVLKAPPVGFISETAIGSDGELVVFVQDPARPMGPAAPFPADCPPPSSG
jgi:hypothetical protein